MAFADCYTVLYRLSADPFDAPFEPSGGVPVADSEKGSMLDHVSVRTNRIRSLARPNSEFSISLRIAATRASEFSRSPRKSSTRIRRLDRLKLEIR
jgi:hypothetical protein